MMKYAFLMTFIISGLLFSTATFAEETLDCEHPGNSLAQNACFQRDYDASDKALNLAFKAVKKRITGEFQSEPKSGEDMQHKLLQAQRSWLQFRQQHCDVVAFETEAGSSARFTETQICMTHMNQDRVGQLDKIIGP